MLPETSDKRVQYGQRELSVVKKRKLFEKAFNSPGNVRFDEFVTLLKAFGFTLDRVRGSHHVFVHPELGELLSIQSKQGGKAKPYQLRQFFKLVEQYNLSLNEDE